MNWFGCQGAWVAVFPGRTAIEKVLAIGRIQEAAKRFLQV